MDEVARELAKGPPPDWLVPRLEHFAKMIAMPKAEDDQTVEATLISSALYLRDWLPLYVHAAEMMGQDVPEIVERVLFDMGELIEFMSSEMLSVMRPRRQGGPTPDSRKRLCAAVCINAWQEIHGKVEPYAMGLWNACEAYWQACGHTDPTKWQRLIEEMSHP